MHTQIPDPNPTPASSPTVNYFGIDVSTKDAGWLRLRLSKLRTTLCAQDGGRYHADPGYSQVHLATLMTEDELDTYLYTRNVGEYVGIFDLMESAREALR